MGVTMKKLFIMMLIPAMNFVAFSYNFNLEYNVILNARHQISNLSKSCPVFGAAFLRAIRPFFLSRPFQRDSKMV